MKSLRNFVLIAGSLALSGCSVFSSFSEVEALNQTEAMGSPFTQALTREYRAYANNLLNDEFDYPDALHFARKGLVSASGDVTLPEALDDWSLSDKHRAELGAARGRLIVAFDLGGREVVPDLAAMTQARFDCWIENQEESWRVEEGSWGRNDMDTCKNEFASLINQLESAVQQPAQKPAPAKPVGVYDVDAAAPMQAENAMYLVFFDWDSSALGAAANNVLDAISGEISHNPPNAINIVGHADTSGAKAYNKRLAFKRANTARDALIERGIDPTLIAVDAKGETELLVPTADNVREPANRRVNISFE